jgi:beta-aspartyl-peptidase (threonine type)
MRLLLLAFCLVLALPSSAQNGPVAIAIHGGAGTITRDNMTPEAEEAYRQALETALRAGHAVLEAGGTSMDAIVVAIQSMEADPLFNAGVGAVLTEDGFAELDASIMRGEDRAAGAVAGVRTVASPIELARLVMERSPHVMMAGRGAEAFAASQGLKAVDNAIFVTPRRRQALDRALERRQRTGALPDSFSVGSERMGTVGAVALDRMGNLAAGTSTGGMTAKQYGRVGDAPIIGAGTYADNETCAVSATGHGEYFIRGVVAYDIASMMRYGGLSLSEAANAVVHGRLTDLGGTGGVIAMDAEGNVSMPFNTSGMYRGVISTDGELSIGIYRD